MTTDTRGFTLMEVMIALVVLSIVVLGFSSTSATLIRSASMDRNMGQASASVEGRLALIRQWPDYASLDTFARNEVDVPQEGWNRRTQVQRIGGPTQSNDFKRITVTVAGNGLTEPVSRTITVAAP